MQLRPKKREMHFERGTYFHELLHFYYNLIKTGYAPGSEMLEAAMDSKLRSDLEEIAFDYHGVMLQVHLMMRRFLERDYAKQLDQGIEVLEVEKELYYELNESVAIHGFVDLIYKSKGQVIIRDHKTGERKNAHTTDSIRINDQLLTYAVIWWLETGEIPVIEISWFNSKVDYTSRPTNDQIFNRVRKTLTREYLEAFWQYLQDYVYHMQTVPAIRFINDWKCKTCPYIEPCLMSLQGHDIGNLLKSNYKKVSRNHDYAKFTELAKKKSPTDSQSKKHDAGTGGLNLNFNLNK